MAVTVPVSLPPAEEEAALVVRAQAEGVSADAFLDVVRLISPSANIGPKSLTADEWEKEFDEWLDSMPDLPLLSAQAIRRESTYL